MNYLFVPLSFAVSRQHPTSLLWFIKLHLNPYLQIVCSVSSLALGLFQGSGSLSSLTSQPSARRAFMFYQIVPIIEVSHVSDYNSTSPPPLVLFTMFKFMCLTTFSENSKPLLNIVQIMVSEVIMFHENKYMFPSGDSYDISPVNNDPTKRITLIL